MRHTQTHIWLPLVSSPNPILLQEKRSGKPSWISWASTQFCNIHCNLATFKKNWWTTCSKKEGYSNGDDKFYCCKGSLLNNHQSCNLIGLYRFWVISPRNSTSFTRSFLTGRRTQAGHETKLPHTQVSFQLQQNTGVCQNSLVTTNKHLPGTKTKRHIQQVDQYWDFVWKHLPAGDFSLLQTQHHSLWAALKEKCFPVRHLSIFTGFLPLCDS